MDKNNNKKFVKPPYKDSINYNHIALLVIDSYQILIGIHIGKY